MSAPATDLTVATTILEQLGGGMFVAMTGARDLVGGPDRLQFRIGSGAKDGINKVRVTLTPMDTYTLDFWRVVRRAGECSTPVHVQEEDVYAEDLRDVFTRVTGFHTSLGTRGRRA